MNRSSAPIQSPEQSSKYKPTFARFLDFCPVLFSRCLCRVPSKNVPFLIGAALALGLARWGRKASLPRIPAGDTVVVAEAGFRSSFALAGLFEKVDARLRGFPAGCLSLVTIALILAALAAKAR
jgi:hypothetical protein